MGVEIERKYLVNKEEWSKVVPHSSVNIIQAYLCSDEKKTIRLRTAGEKAFITIKGKTNGISRLEFEYELPLTEVQQLIQSFTEKKIEKIRHYVHIGKKKWEVDEFKGDNEGLFVAEIELEGEDEIIDIPVWIGEEVSHDRRYANSNLIKNPFKNWVNPIV